jgi:pilus assembly protein Flp/PilA
MIILNQRQRPVAHDYGEEKEGHMKNLILKLRVWKDTRGQDLIEYALMAGFVAVAAGAIMPGVATSISTIFSKIASVLTAAAAQGS